jgi:hypothetical protein
MNNTKANTTSDQSKHKSAVTQKEKLLISLLSGVLFLIVSSPIMYKLVNSITMRVGIDIETAGCPHLNGLVLHSVVFVILVFIIMQF